MTADEIRKRTAFIDDYATDVEFQKRQIFFLVEMVGEVAAQLAELNDTLQDIRLNISDLLGDFAEATK